MWNVAPQAGRLCYNCQCQSSTIIGYVCAKTSFPLNSFTHGIPISLPMVNIMLGFVWDCAAIWTLQLNSDDVVFNVANLTGHDNAISFAEGSFCDLWLPVLFTTYFRGLTTQAMMNAINSSASDPQMIPNSLWGSFVHQRRVHHAGELHFVLIAAAPSVGTQLFVCWMRHTESKFANVSWKKHGNKCLECCCQLVFFFGVPPAGRTQWVETSTKPWTFVLTFQATNHEEWWWTEQNSGFIMTMGWQTWTFRICWEPMALGPQKASNACPHPRAGMCSFSMAPVELSSAWQHSTCRGGWLRLKWSFVWCRGSWRQNAFCGRMMILSFTTYWWLTSASFVSELSQVPACVLAKYRAIAQIACQLARVH